MIEGVHHIAIICSNYEHSKDFYTRILGFEIIAEHFRPQRNSYKLDLRISENLSIELFSFPSPPPRPSHPEACGLRHVCLRTNDLEADITRLLSLGVLCEAIRTDAYTGKRFTFFADPDGLPIELYEG